MSAEDKRVVRIAQQFRESHNMTYELDCAGSPLIVRMFPEGDAPNADWRVEVRMSDAEDAVVAKATAPSRAEAFQRVAHWWRDNGATQALPAFDWDAIAKAMTDVRAL